MTSDRIVVRGAREHNLKDVSLDLPRDALIVFTGLSGSGKSSLAFDTIFAEGQRRYVESLSAYARQFLGQMDKPDVDFIEGLSPAVSIDQKSTSRNPRSTVGTITEVYDYLRLLYARAGRPHCPTCGAKIERQTPQQIVDRVLTLEEGRRFQVLAPVIRGRKGEYVELFSQLQTQGFSRVRVDGETHSLDAPPTLDKKLKHTIEVVVAQGTRTFRVLGVRRTGDPLPQPREAGVARLVLATAEGQGRLAGLTPGEAVYVDAEADDAFPAPPGRPAAIPESEQLMASEVTVLPLLATCLAALVLATLLIISARQRWSAVLVWVLASPVVIALAWVTTDVLVRLLPNVM